MGIRQLHELITEEAPGAITYRSPDSYRGKILAIDASIVIHQFHCAVPAITNHKGDEIRVLQGLFQRTVFMLQNGIKPLYVFDGIPPENKRFKKTENNQGTDQRMDTKDGKVQFRRRVNPAPTIGSDKWKDLKTLLEYLGVPFIQAPSEAEATCAHLVLKDVAWGAVTEDMDALPFSCHRLLRNLKADKKIEVKEYNLPEILKQLNVSREQFVDLCILLGCDYTSKIKGLGRKKALKMIQEYKNIEGIIQVKSQEQIPPDFDYVSARRQFLSPDVAEVHLEDLKWTMPDNDKVRNFLCREKHMKEARVNNVLQKLQPPKTQKRKSNMTKASPNKQRKISEFYRAKKLVHQDKSSPGGRHVSSAQ